MGRVARPGRDFARPNRDVWPVGCALAPTGDVSRPGNQASVVELCPSCCRAPIQDPRTGWCRRCSSEAVVARYLEQGRKAAEERRRR